MSTDEATTAARTTLAPTPVFSGARANRALALVRRIVADVVAGYRELTELRSEHDRLRALAAAQSRPPAASPSLPPDAGQSCPPVAGQSRLPPSDDQIAACVQRLKRLAQELATIGCVLKDCRAGLVDFPAVRHGRRVWLCWRFDEPAVAYWHELDDGLAGRQPIGDNFDN